MYRHLCCIVTMASLTAASTTTFCPLSSPLGENSYVPADPSNAIAAKMISECAMYCFRNANCNSFSYNETSQLCFFITNNSTVKSNGTDSFSYQVEPDRFVGSPGGNPVVDAENCSFPFTHNGQLYHSCFESVSDPANLCNRFACLLPHRKYATCRPPTDYVAPDTVVTITVGIHLDVLSLIAVSLVSKTVQFRSVGGWVLIHQKLNDNLSFDRPWSDYRNGFGNFSDNYWIGLEYMWGIVTKGAATLRVEFQLESSQSWYSGEYDSFSVGDENSYYTLSTSGYSGDIDDPLQALNGMKFSTSDLDNSGSQHCPYSCKAGWWFNGCSGTNFNGPINTQPSQPICFAVSGGTSSGFANTIRELSVARMMIKAAA